MAVLRFDIALNRAIYTLYATKVLISMSSQ